MALRLWSLANLLWTTGRAAEAEPMMARAAAIYLRFQASTSHTHPHKEPFFTQYRHLLALLGHDAPSIDRVIAAAHRAAGLG